MIRSIERTKNTLYLSFKIQNDYRRQLAFDETSYDEKLCYCTIVYWPRDTRKYDRGENREPALLKSTDGGKTWLNCARNKGDGSQGPQAARDISHLDINPLTRECLHQVLAEAFIRWYCLRNKNLKL